MVKMEVVAEELLIMALAKLHSLQVQQLHQDKEMQEGKLIIKALLLTELAAAEELVLLVTILLQLQLQEMAAQVYRTI